MAVVESHIWLKPQPPMARLLGRLLYCLVLVCGMRSVRARVSEALGTANVSDRSLGRLAQHFSVDGGAAHAEDQGASEHQRKRTRRNKNTHRATHANTHGKQRTLNSKVLRMYFQKKRSRRGLECFLIETQSRDFWPRQSLYV